MLAALEFTPLAFMELLVVLAFAIGWAILELVTRRLDKRRAREDAEKEGDKDLAGQRTPTRHTEGQHGANDRVGHAIERQAFMHGDGAFAKKYRFYERTCVEGCVLERLDKPRGAFARACLPSNPPQRPGKWATRGRVEILDAAIGGKAQGEAERAPVAAFDIVDDSRPTFDRRPGPIPSREAGLDWFIAKIAVKIAGARPTQRRGLHLHIDAGPRSDGMPAMPAVAIENELTLHKAARPYPHGAPDPHRQRHRDLINLDGERRAVPIKPARADRKRCIHTFEIGPRPLGQGPALARSIQCDVQRAVIERIAMTETMSESVVRRERAADEGDKRERMLPIIA
jgi:hypothetical protein